MASKARDSNSTEEIGFINVEERITSLFEPDTLGSAQYMENLRKKTLFEPGVVRGCRQLLSGLCHGARRKRTKAVQRCARVDYENGRRLGFFVCERLRDSRVQSRIRPPRVAAVEAEEVGKYCAYRGLEAEKDDRLKSRAG